MQIQQIYELIEYIVILIILIMTLIKITVSGIIFLITLSTSPNFNAIALGIFIALILFLIGGFMWIREKLIQILQPIREAIASNPSSSQAFTNSYSHSEVIPTSSKSSEEAEDDFGQKIRRQISNLVSDSDEDPIYPHYF